MPALTPSVLLANQYEAFPALPGPPHGRAGGQDRPVSGRAGHDSARQAGLGQRQTGQVRAGQGRKVLGRDREAPRSVGRRSVPDRAEQGRIQKNSKGWVMNRSGAPTYTQNSKNSTDFGHFISVVPYFQFILLFFKLFSNLACGAPAGQVVPLAGPWCL